MLPSNTTALHCRALKRTSYGLHSKTGFPIPPRLSTNLFSMLLMLAGLPHERSLSDLERIDYGYRAPLADFVTLDGFMSTLSRNSRHQLRRSMRAYERTGPLSIEAARDTQTALAFFAKMKEFHIRSWTRRGRQHAFASPFFETFHRSLICRGVGNGTVDLLRVSAGERTIGYLYNFLNAGTVSSYQGGFDDADGRMRPGYVCHALAITHYAANGMSSYDFLAGKNRLKQSFGSERYEFCWQRLHKPNSVFSSMSLPRPALNFFHGQD